MRKARHLYFVYMSLILRLQFHLYLNQHTLDFPIVRIHTGLCKVINQYVRPQQALVTYNCYGVILSVQFWFVNFEIILTPFYFKEKK